MSRIFTRFKIIFNRLTGNIAFYPSLLAFIGLCFGFLILFLEEKGISKFLIEQAPSLVINDAETARTLLSTFIGGIISLMVFSFSMVMILLNQASSNYSPRILPGLISNKRHQIVLGYYIATLTYCILILLSIKPTDNKYQLPGFAVLLGILMAMIVLACFIYFIHAISQAIQINNIIDNIYTKAKGRLEHLISETDETGNEEDFPDVSDWNTYTIDTTGYLETIATDDLINLGNEDHIKFDILKPKGSFILKGIPIAKASKKLSEEQEQKLMACFGFSPSEIVTRNYIFGFKQLTEIAVKAMSPGINDPGTAITCIDYLTQLFTIRLHKDDQSYIFEKGKEDAAIRLRTIDLEELLYFVFAPLRVYCKNDVVMLYKMLNSLYYMLQVESQIEDYKNHIVEQINLILEDAKKNITNTTDLKRLQGIAQHIVKINPTNITIKKA